MSTTLTNGLKLPDKGSVDWYADMQSNYAILDGAVGTIAEHTSALAGKAPAVHTHTKADITDFPAYGTTAGTICEGNDSRLSDARTPVAHTHLTADVTDLLNTAHEWTKTQTYSNANAIIIKNNDVEIGNEPSAYNEQRFIFRDKNNQQIAAIKYQNQLSSNNVFNNSLEFSATDKFKDGVRDATGTAITTVLRIGLWNDGTKYIYNEGRWRTSHIPFVNNAVDIGSSSYQWNNLYAKNYYYNGVAWGLDKYNIWTNSQVYKLTGTEVGSTTSGYISLSFTDKNNANLGLQRASVYSDGRTCFSWKIYNTDNNSQSISSSLEYYITKAEVKVFAPVENGEVNLGTSTNKWKTFNGLNPGALSLPNYDDTTYIDISGSIVPPNGETEINKNLGYNEYTPPIDGWLSIRCDGATFLQIYRNAYNCPGITSCDPSGGKLVVTLPVRKNVTYTIRIKTSGTTNFYQLYPCQGNV